MHQIERLIEIDRRVRAALEPRAGDLAAEFEVSRRQIYLDRAKLIEMGAPLARAAGGGWVYSEPSWVLPTAYLSEGELLAFFLSVEIARAQGNLGLEAPLQSAVAKIAAGLGDLVSVDLNTLRASTSYGASPAARVDAGLYAQLGPLIAARRAVAMRYYTASRGQWGERVVHPYHLYFARGEWFLIAHDEGRAEVLCFNIARIARLRPLEARFCIAPDFDAQQYVREMFCTERGESVVEVAIRFDPYQARYIREREWKSEQTIEEAADGGLTLKFPASGLNEIARWVMGYGRHAEVLGPPELRDIVADHIGESARLYAADIARREQL